MVRVSALAAALVVGTAGLLAAAPRPAGASTAAPACTGTQPAPGWVVRENRRPGFSAWRPDRSGRVPAVKDYVDDPSLACGDALVVRLGGSAGRVRVQVVRIGWYGGSGARLVWTSAPVDVPRATVPAPARHLQPGAGWTTHVAARVTDAWTPGLYLAEVVVAGRVTGLAPFVVRNVSRPSALVAVDSNLTWSAYSMSGGASLYVGPVRLGTTRVLSPAGRAYTVSLHRPTDDPAPLTYDVPLAALAEQSGIALDHVLDTDLDSRPGLLANRAGVVLPGHSEYWTRTAYDELTAAEARGVNVLNLGANAIYWQARVSYDAAGAPVAMTVYRYADLDPVSSQRPELTTVRWQDAPLDRPAATQLGNPYGVARASGGLVVHDAPAWLGVPNGTVLPHAVAGEVDSLSSGAGSLPPNVQTVLVGVLRGQPPVLVTSTYFSAPSGAAVFDAGVTTWLCRATGTCPGDVVPAATSRTLRSLTVRLLSAFSQPRFGASHPSRPDIPPPAQVLRRRLPAAATGWYGTE